jgi:hypothetical protein
MAKKSDMKPAVLVKTTTAVLTDLSRQQAASGQQPDDAILNELKKRYHWTGCPAEDIALIADLDRSVLMPLFGGYTQLPPRQRHIHGAKMSPIPVYYQKQQNQNPSLMNISLKKLRSGLNDSQRNLLTLFWEYFLDHGKWPSTFSIHRSHHKKEVADCLRSVGGNLALAGNIVREAHVQYGVVYELTLVGILLTKDGQDYQNWLLQLVDFLRTEYFHGTKEGENIEFDGDEIGRALKLNPEQRRILGELTRFESVYQSYGHTAGDNWKIRLPHEIQGVSETDSIGDYYEEVLFRYFKNEKWVYQNERNAQMIHSPPVLVSDPEEPDTSFNDTSLETVEDAKDSQKGSSKSAKIFISHSKRDKKLMQALTDLLKAAFRLPTKDILCTSIAGHKLAGGADTEEELLALLRDANLLIGVLTPASLASSYVLFELGARWGLKKPLISLVACGTKMRDIKEPLKSKNALNASDQDDVHQLIEDIAKCLGQKSEPPSAYNTKVRQLVLAAAKSTPHSSA